MDTCIFCQLPQEAIIMENTHCIAFFDQHPVSKGHLLVIPKNHKENYFDLTPLELADLHVLLLKLKVYVDQKYAPDGYNIGFNCGATAGQSVFHCHCHLIPRYLGDHPHPKGGIRGVIPAKMNYD